MSSLTVFNFQSQEVRFVGTANDPWWVAADVCAVLEILNVSDAVSRLDEDEKMISVLAISGQNRETLCINESGLYSPNHSTRPSLCRYISNNGAEFKTGQEKSLCNGKMLPINLYEDCLEVQNAIHAFFFIKGEE